MSTPRQYSTAGITELFKWDGPVRWSGKCCKVSVQYVEMQTFSRFFDVKCFAGNISLVAGISNTVA